MTRDHLQQISRATGESYRTIIDRGFTVYLPDESAEPETLLVLDCPFCGLTILLSGEGPDGLPELAECDGCDLVFDYQDHEVEQMTLAQFLLNDECGPRRLLYV